MWCENAFIVIMWKVFIVVMWKNFIDATWKILFHAWPVKKNKFHIRPMKKNYTWPVKTKDFILYKNYISYFRQFAQSTDTSWLGTYLMIISDSTLDELV